MQHKHIQKVYTQLWENTNLSPLLLWGELPFPYFPQTTEHNHLFRLLSYSYSGWHKEQVADKIHGSHYSKMFEWAATSKQSVSFLLFLCGPTWYGCIRPTAGETHTTPQTFQVLIKISWPRSVLLFLSHRAEVHGSQTVQDQIITLSAW